MQGVVELPGSEVLSESPQPHSCKMPASHPIEPLTLSENILPPEFIFDIIHSAINLFRRSIQSFLQVSLIPFSSPCARSDMASDLVYPLSAVTLGAVAVTNIRALPYAAAIVVLVLIWNAFKGSRFSSWVTF
jgi:hypothetical protein